MKILLPSLLLLFSSCIHTPKIQRPFAVEVQLESKYHTESISMEEVNSGNDLMHRTKAKELGISYVDYLHMVNNGKIKATKSSPTTYHKHQ